MLYTYLEDCVDSIEYLPIKLKDMLITIRELDSAVQTATGEKVTETEEFFHNAEKMHSAKRESVFQSLMLDFGQIVKNADEKVNVAESLHSILEKHLEQLDQQIAEFKIVLEANKPGITSVVEEKLSKTKKRGRPRKTSSASSSSTSSSTDEVPPSEPQFIDVLPATVVNGTIVSMNVEATVWTGMDLTRYCICNEIAYGDMIACDNPSCPYEWFHYNCVNLITAPEGSWYCPNCILSSQSMPSAACTCDTVPLKL